MTYLLLMATEVLEHILPLFLTDFLALADSEVRILSFSEKHSVQNVNNISQHYQH